jgi:predicted amidohydrolase
MSVKVASICMSNEKAWVGEKLTYFYSLPGMSEEEVLAVADFYIGQSVKLIEKAASNGAKMACLPEVTIEIGKWLRSVERVQRMDMARRCWERTMAAWSRVTAQCDIVLVGGIIEPDGDRLYNSAPVIDERGNLLGCYRKVQLAATENECVSYGEGFPVFQTKYGRVGALICWDIMFPEAAMSLAYNGAQIIFQPTYGHSGWAADVMAQTRAMDTCCPFVISMWDGAGAIIDRDGKILARAQRTRDWRDLIPDQILYAEVDPTGQRKFIAYNDYGEAMLHQRRWSAYTPRR